jgi:hypothetical protein
MCCAVRHQIITRQFIQQEAVPIRLVFQTKFIYPGLFSRLNQRKYISDLAGSFTANATYYGHNSVAPEPEGSSPHSQQPANCPYPEPGESTPHPPTNLRKVHFDPILTSTPRSSKWSFSFGLSHQNPVHVSPLSDACYMPRPHHIADIAKCFCSAIEYRQLDSNIALHSADYPEAAMCCSPS